MTILAFDCAGPVLSAGLLAGEVFFGAEARGGQKHSELIMDMADYLLKSAGVVPEELDAAACMRGPGSFTGLRIGFATVKGLSLALGIPFVSVPTLDCMAWAHNVWPGIVVPALDAKKKAFFIALYRSGTALTSYLDAGVEEIQALVAENLRENESVLLTGPGGETLASFLDGKGDFRAVIDPAAGRGRVWELLKLAEISIVQGIAEKSPGPLYIRKSDAELRG